MWHLSKATLKSMHVIITQLLKLQLVSGNQWSVRQEGRGRENRLYNFLENILQWTNRENKKITIQQTYLHFLDEAKIRCRQGSYVAMGPHVNLE